MGALTIDYDTLRREVGRSVGYPRDPAQWDPDQEQDVGDAIARGLSTFYWPPLLEGQNERHLWSFLQKTFSVSCASGTYAYDLPDDYLGIVGGLTQAAASGHLAIERTSEERLRAAQAMRPKSGTPRYCAVRAKDHEPTLGTRYEILLYPTPDASYTPEGRYLFEPPTLDEVNQYPVGGGVHRETILESCLAAAEVMLNDGEGPHQAKFMAALAASIQIDAGPEVAV